MEADQGLIKAMAAEIDAEGVERRLPARPSRMLRH